MVVSSRLQESCSWRATALQTSVSRIGIACRREKKKHDIQIAGDTYDETYGSP
jgi:hypothetical protein